MRKSRRSLKSSRSHAYTQQNGRCYYCRQLMWVKTESEVLSKYKITIKQARLLKCTGEHLIAHKDGGHSDQNNIVAACLYCNTQRHRRKKHLRLKDINVWFGSV